MIAPIIKNFRVYPLDLYHEIFEPNEGDSALVDLANTFWTSSEGSVFCSNFSKSKEMIRVLAVGVGNGRTELPLLERLAMTTGCPIDVHCVEPNWITGNSDFLAYAMGECQHYHNESTNTIKRADLNITLHREFCSIEEWLDKAKGGFICDEYKYDVILFIFVAPLLSDWKSVIADLLVRLKAGGLFVYAENTHDIMCLDGGEIELSGEEYSNLTKSDWGRFWGCLYDIRDTLMISRQMLLPHRNADFLIQVFKSCSSHAGSSIRHAIFTADAEFKKTLDHNKARQLITSISPVGNIVNTFSALRIPDDVTGPDPSKRLRTLFLEKAHRLLEDKTIHWPLDYTVGIRLYGIIPNLPPPSNGNSSDHVQPGDTRVGFLQAVGRELAHEGIAKFLAAKSNVKRWMAVNTSGDDIPSSWKRKRAIASGLATFRDLAAISADALLVLYAHDSSGIPYSYSLLPRSICPEGNEVEYPLQKEFVRRYTRYMTAGADERLSGHFLKEELLRFFQDFSVIFRLRKVSAPHVHFGHFIGTRPHAIVLDFPAADAVSIRQALCSLNMPGLDEVTKTWHEWEDTQSSATYLSLDSLPELPKTLASEAILQECLGPHKQAIVKAFERACEDHSSIIPSEIGEIIGAGLQTVLHLLFFHWAADDTPCWSTVVYSVSSVAQDAQEGRATTLLAFLPTADAICHSLDHPSVQPVDRAFAGHFMEMGSMLSLYLSEIELIRYSMDKAAMNKYYELQEEWGHEVAKYCGPCKKLLSIQNIDNTVKTIIDSGLLAASIWSGAASLYEPKYGPWANETQGKSLNDYFKDIFMTSWHMFMITKIKNYINSAYTDISNDKLAWNNLSKAFNICPIELCINGSWVYNNYPSNITTNSKVVSMYLSQIFIGIFTNAFKHTLLIYDITNGASLVDFLLSDDMRHNKINVYVSSTDDKSHSICILNKYNINNKIPNQSDLFWSSGTPHTINMGGIRLLHALGSDYNMHSFVEFIIDRDLCGFRLNIPFGLRLDQMET